MKTIGIIGGTSWPSTISPYEIINREIAARLGGFHSARIIVYSIDYDPIKSLYHHGWDRIPGLLKREIKFAAALKPDCLFLANNTLHKAVDLIGDSLKLSMPFFHAVHLTRTALLELEISKALFLGTAFTMEDDFFQAPLRQAGITLTIPDALERAEIQVQQSRLAKNEKPDDPMVEFFAALLAKYRQQGCEAAILACTELPLAISNTITDMKLIDPLKLQCHAAVDFALKS
jgi:aspartate racemase